MEQKVKVVYSNIIAAGWYRNWYNFIINCTVFDSCMGLTDV